MHDFDPDPGGSDVGQVFEVGPGEELFFSVQWDQPLVRNSVTFYYKAITADLKIDIPIQNCR